MDVKKVNLYLAKYGKHFSSLKHAALREALMQVPDEYFDEIISTDLLNPTYMQVASVLGGITGIDRFLLGDKKMGFVKLFLLGGCGVVAIIDMFKVQGRTKRKNYKKIMKCIAAVAEAPIMDFDAPATPMPVPMAPMYAQQPYAPVAPTASVAPVAPVAPMAAPKAPVMAQAPVAPAAPAYVVPSAPKSPVAPVAPVAPISPISPVAPVAPIATPVVTAPPVKAKEEKAAPVAEAPKAEEKKVEEVKIPDIAPTPYKK